MPKLQKRSSLRKLTEQTFLKAAKRIYQDEGRIEIDDNAEVSMPDDESGAYVAAWVYVSCNDL